VEISPPSSEPTTTTPNGLTGDGQAQTLTDLELVSDTISIEPGSVTCLSTPCYLEGQKVWGLIDSGANTSFVSYKWVQAADIPIVPVSGTIHQCLDGSTNPDWEE
jgi:hypothetical protein